MNGTDLVARISRRGQVPESDARFAGLLGDLNEALHEWEASNPNGWDYALRKVTVPTVASQADYSLAVDVAPLVYENVARVLPLYPVLKVASVDYIAPDDGIYPLERLPATTARGSVLPSLNTWGVATLAAFSVEGGILTIYPTPSVVADLVLRVVIGEVDLTTGDEFPLIPQHMQPGLVQLARAISFEGQGDDAAATLARERYSALRRQALGADRPYRGPGRVG